MITDRLGPRHRGDQIDVASRQQRAGLAPFICQRLDASHFCRGRQVEPVSAYRLSQLRDGRRQLHGQRCRVAGHRADEVGDHHVIRPRILCLQIGQLQDAAGAALDRGSRKVPFITDGLSAFRDDFEREGTAQVRTAPLRLCHDGHRLDHRNRDHNRPHELAAFAHRQAVIARSP